MTYCKVTKVNITRALHKGPGALHEGPGALLEGPGALHEGPGALYEGPGALHEGGEQSWRWELLEGCWSSPVLMHCA